MTPTEYQEAIKGVIEDIEGGVHADLMIQLAGGVIMTIKKRIQETGIDSNGKLYHGYTPQYQKFKEGKVRRRVYETDKTIKKNKKTGKALKGPFYPNRYKGYTDFSLTNDMWNSTQVQKSESNTNLAVIGARGNDLGNVSNELKMEVNTKRFGPILDLSEQEKSDLLSDYNAGILQIWRNHGL